MLPGKGMKWACRKEEAEKISQSAVIYQRRIPRGSKVGRRVEHILSVFFLFSVAISRGKRDKVYSSLRGPQDHIGLFYTSLGIRNEDLRADCSATLPRKASQREEDAIERNIVSNKTSLWPIFRGYQCNFRQPLISRTLRYQNAPFQIFSDPKR